MGLTTNKVREKKLQMKKGSSFLHISQDIHICNVQLSNPSQGQE